jgi:hypothetical protein
MTYKISEWNKAGQDFENTFKIGIRKFYDGLATMVFKYIQINPFVFDDYLYEKHDDYIEGISMQDIVLKHYGEKGLEMLNALLPSEADNE